jgi:hypothetical protein
MDKRKGKSFTVSDKIGIIKKKFFLCWNTLTWHYIWDVRIKHNYESCEASEGSYIQCEPL